MWVNNWSDYWAFEVTAKRKKHIHSQHGVEAHREDAALLLLHTRNGRRQGQDCRPNAQIKFPSSESWCPAGNPRPGLLSVGVSAVSLVSPAVTDYVIMQLWHVFCFFFTLFKSGPRIFSFARETTGRMRRFLFSRQLNWESQATLSFKIAF